VWVAHNLKKYPKNVFLDVKYANAFVEAPTLQLSFLCLYTNQHTDLVSSSLTTTANHSLTPNFSVYFHKQRKQPLTSGTTFWKPRPSAVPTSQWQSRLTSSDLYKRSHLTSERGFIQKGLINTEDPTARPHSLMGRAHHRSSRHPAAAPVAATSTPPRTSGQPTV
jgi:hypothetical protein